MFGRLVTIKLKVDSAKELVRINQKTIVPLLRKQTGFRDESLHIAPCGSEAIAKTSWTTKEDAESYDRLFRAEILMALANVVEGRPMMEGFESAGAAFQKGIAKLRELSISNFQNGHRLCSSVQFHRQANGQRER